MHRFRLVSCLLGWLCCLQTAANEPSDLRYDGYEAREIRIYFEYAGDGRDWLVQPPPLSLGEDQIALGFQGNDDTGRFLREWVFPNTYFLGYYLRTEENNGERYAIFERRGLYPSVERLALRRERSLWIEQGYFGTSDSGASLSKAFRGDSVNLNGRIYAVEELAPHQAVIRDVQANRIITLPLSPLGTLRGENLKLRREVEKLRRDYWGLQNPDMTIKASLGALLLFNFALCYACIFFGLLTLEDHQPKHSKR